MFENGSEAGAKVITGSEAMAMFDDMLDDVCDEVKIGDLSYTPSQVLFSVDPIAYRCEFANYVSSLHEDGEYVVEGYN